MTSQPGKQTIAIHVLTHISRSKCNQATKFDQLIKYNMRNNSFKKSYKNMIEKLFPGPFFKNQKWAYLWINNLKFYTVCFYCMPSSGLLKNIETKLKPLAYYTS